MKKALFTLVFCAAVSGDEIKFSELPKPVQISINKKLDGGRLQSVERELENGGTNYLAIVRREDGASQLRVTSSGEIIAIGKAPGFQTGGAKGR